LTLGYQTLRSLAQGFICAFHNPCINTRKASSMNKILLSTAVLTTLGATGAVQAQEMGRVLSRTAVYQQVAVPRQVCSLTQVAVPAQKSGAGALMGAVAGGAVGNAIGDGTGRALATMVGVIGGTMLGDKIEGNPPDQIQNQQTCTTQTVYENRLVGYNVTYEYAGKQYSVQLPQDPGPTIALQVTPMGAPVTPAPVIPAPVVVPAPAVISAPISRTTVILPAAPVMVTHTPHVYASAYRPWQPVSGIHFGFNVGGGRHHHHRQHH
jgi:uncharacterized protein YcfJ